MNIFYLLLIILLSGCNLFDSEKKEAEPKVEQYFRAELNGKPWSGAPTSVLMNLGGLPWLDLFATRIDTVSFPYQENISFPVHFDSEKSIYDVLRKTEENNRTSGGFYVELDGDAVIAWYYPNPDTLNTLMIQIEQDEEGRRLVTGTFAMTVVVDPKYDTELNNQYRQQPDTVRITNGEFRVLLEERG